MLKSFFRTLVVFFVCAISDRDDCRPTTMTADRDDGCTGGRLPWHGVPRYLPAMELRRGVVETVGISAVESVETIELVEAHYVELRFKFGDGLGIGVHDI